MDPVRKAPEQAAALGGPQIKLGEPAERAPKPAGRPREGGQRKKRKREKWSVPGMWWII